MGTKVGLWEGLYSAIADTLWEFGSGNLLTRTTVAGAVTDTTLTVEGTDRFPAAGNIAVGGRLYAYTGKTATTFTGLNERLGPTVLNATAGLIEAVDPYAVVTDFTRSETQIDKLRQSFLVLYAEDTELDVIGRNHGIPRPRGINDTIYRALLQALIAIEATTMYSFEQALDALLGSGNYSLYEKVHIAEHRHKVFVGIPAAGSTVSAGKGYLAGYETQQRVTATTIDVNDDALLAYGVYLATDYRREGTNYAMLTTPSPGATSAVDPTRFQDVPSNPFLAGDVGSPIILHFVNDSGMSQHWKVTSYTSANTINLGWDLRHDGNVNVAVNNQRFVTDAPWFAPWVGIGSASDEGCMLVITSGPNAGSYVVEGYISPYEIEIGSTFPATDTDMTWRLQPNFTANPVMNVEYELWRASVSGNTITTPENMPAATDLLVDYTNVRSGELLKDSTEDGTSQHPLYLYDGTGTARQVIELLEAAGVIVETELTS